MDWERVNEGYGNLKDDRRVFGGRDWETIGSLSDTADS
jgi:hypothetical protein